MEPGQFSDAIKHAAHKHYGQAGRAFLERLAWDNRNWIEHHTGFKNYHAFGTCDNSASSSAVFAAAGAINTIARAQVVERVVSAGVLSPRQHQRVDDALGGDRRLGGARAFVSSVRPPILAGLG